MTRHEQQTNRPEKMSNFFGGNNFLKLNFYKFLLVIFLCEFSLCALNAANTERDILNKAFAVSKTTSFESVVEKVSMGTEEYTLLCYQLWDQEKKFLYKRLDYIKPGVDDYKVPNAIVQSNRYNLSGNYICKKNIVIKSPGQVNWIVFPNLMNERLSFTSVTASYQNIPCFEITVIVPNEKPIRISYLVGRDNNFIYAWKAYENNKPVKKFEFGKVNFNVQLSPAWFNVPANIEIRTSNNPQEIHRLVSGKSGTRGPVVAELSNAMKITAETQFKAKMLQITPESKSFHVVFYQCPDMENNFVYKRMDFMRSPEIIENSKRSNKSGFYMCVGNAIIKRKYPNIFVPPQINFNYEDNLTVLSKETIFKNMPCVEYTVRYPDNYPLPERMNKDDWGYVQKYYVGKDNHFIYAWEEFNNKGRRISSVVFVDVDFNVNLTHDFFDIPKGIKIYENCDTKEFQKLLSAATPLTVK